MPTPTLQEQFGQIDIYLFDQLLKGRIARGMRILDSGCGGGRNLVYLLREGYEVYATDLDAAAVESVRALARRLAPGLPDANFRVEATENMSFEDGCADVVISNTVLHFARDDAHFEAMLRGVVAGAESGRAVFLQVGVDDWDGESGSTNCGAAVLVAGWVGAVFGGRGAAGGAHGTAGRRTGGPDQDHGGAQSTLDDYLGDAEETVLKRHPAPGPIRGAAMHPLALPLLLT